MSTFFIIILSIALILISLFSILIILMQRPSEDAGMGSALGGGAVTSIFGGEAGNILHRWTIGSTISFFVLSCILSLLYMAREGKKKVVMDLIASPGILATPSLVQEKAGPEAGSSDNPDEQPNKAEVGGTFSEEERSPDAQILSFLKQMEATEDTASIPDGMAFESNPGHPATDSPSELSFGPDAPLLSQEEEEKISEEGEASIEEVEGSSHSQD
jgi:preprotein translocase subunit SecG